MSEVIISLEGHNVLFETDNSDFKNFFISSFPINRKGDFSLPLSEFLLQKNQETFKFFFSSNEVSFSLTDDLKQSLRDRSVPSKYINSKYIEEEDLLSVLESKDFNFKRLRAFQVRNLKKLCSLPYAANFSVPGAGKTSEALAFYAFNRKEGTKLLVVSPINAFTSWNEELKENFPKEGTFKRLKGVSYKTLERNLKGDHEFFITNYESLRNPDKLQVIVNFLRDNEVVLFLDESHKAKAEKTGQQIINLSPFPQKKLILTGTPMPQSPDDLVSQFLFLFPGHQVNFSEDLIDDFQPFYVRTTDEDLSLKKMIRNPGPEELYMVKPYEGQKRLYYEYIVEELDKGKGFSEIFKAKDIKKAYMTFLRFLSNPISIVNLANEIDTEIAEQIFNEGNGAKMDAVIDRAKEIISEGKKVLIWSSFIKSIERLHDNFFDNGIGSEYIHGGVDSEDPDEENFKIDIFENLDTREAKIKRFKESDEVSVLIANPAAAAEAMSLHYVCDNALYLDRTYNAAHFLQSEKRIHRLTEGEDRQKISEIFFLKLRGSVDYHVDYRLAKKTSKMSQFLKDKDIKLEWLEKSKDEFYSNINDDLEKDFQTFFKEQINDEYSISDYTED
tara:strand:+ start:7138 stop:8979 length:1842 start_codon:yes stop_codon:yes gene_type:complete